MYCISLVLASVGVPLASQRQDSRAMACDPLLTALFAPAHPQLGRYEVCTSAAPLAVLAHPGWLVEMAQPLDALGTAGRFNRGRVARLYGGRRVQVARGWIRHGDELESVTLISPYPDVSLTRLMPGTLAIRHFVKL